jgi:hypothetical protein
VASISEMAGVAREQMGVERAKVLASSGQLTLGEMIRKAKELKSIVYHIESALVYYDFCFNYPSRLMSWRGIYDELAMDHNYNDDNPFHFVPTLNEFITLLESAVGKTFTGYKGGNYVMSLNTPVWVANSGEAGSTFVSDIIDGRYGRVIICTKYGGLYVD